MHLPSRRMLHLPPSSDYVLRLHTPPVPPTRSPRASAFTHLFTHVQHLQQEALGPPPSPTFSQSIVNQFSGSFIKFLPSSTHNRGWFRGFFHLYTNDGGARERVYGVKLMLFKYVIYQPHPGFRTNLFSNNLCPDPIPSLFLIQYPHSSPDQRIQFPSILLQLDRTRLTYFYPLEPIKSMIVTGGECRSMWVLISHQWPGPSGPCVSGDFRPCWVNSSQRSTVNGQLDRTRRVHKGNSASLDVFANSLGFPSYSSSASPDSTSSTWESRGATPTQLAESQEQLGECQLDSVHLSTLSNSS
uniref:Uncharacterized protein n=1 Tax=Lactuca sativa TaxID=4236 RepID=A0A9R1WNS5_LACSA|nr:hypothetical protein LSAT_V11C100042590 [Lactuca sativa]